MTQAETRRSRAKIQDVREQRATATPFELRKAKSGDYLLEGYASTWEAYDCYGGVENGGWVEQLHRRAFDRTLAETPDLQLLINHEGMPLARTKSGTLELSTDRIGLKVRAYLDPRDPDVQSLLPKMERGDMDEMSFAFRVKDQEWNNDFTHRMIREVSLQKGDVSVVNYGMNPTTKVSLMVPTAVEALSHVGEREMAELRKLPKEELDSAMQAIMQARGINPAQMAQVERRTNERRSVTIVGAGLMGGKGQVKLSDGTFFSCSPTLAGFVSAEIDGEPLTDEGRGTGTPATRSAADAAHRPNDESIAEGGKGPDAQTACDKSVKGVYCAYCGTDHTGADSESVDDLARALKDDDKKPTAPKEDGGGPSEDEDEKDPDKKRAKDDEKPWPPSDDEDDPDKDEDEKPKRAEPDKDDELPDDEDKPDDKAKAPKSRTIGDQDPKDPSKDDDEDDERKFPSEDDEDEDEDPDKDKPEDTKPQAKPKRADDEDEDDEEERNAIPYADPGYLDGQPRYRLDTEAHARESLAAVDAAIRKYTAQQFSDVKRRVRSALGKYGVAISDEVSADIDHVELRGQKLHPLFVMRDGSELRISSDTWNSWVLLGEVDRLPRRTFGDQSPKDPKKDDDADDAEDDKDEDDRTIGDQDPKDPKKKKDDERTIGDQDPKDPSKDDDEDDEDGERGGKPPWVDDDEDPDDDDKPRRTEPPAEDDEDEDEDPRKRNFSIRRALKDLRDTEDTISLSAASSGLETEPEYRVDAWDPKPPEPEPKPERIPTHRLDEAFAELRGGSSRMDLRAAELATAQELQTPEVVERILNPPPPPEPEPEPEPEPTHRLDEAFAELRGGADPFALALAELAAADEIETPEAVRRIIDPPPPPEPEPEPLPEPTHELDEAYAELRGGEDVYALDRALTATEMDDIEPPEVVQRLLNPPPPPEPEPEEVHQPVDVRSALDEFMAEDRKRYSLDEALAAAGAIADVDPNAPTTTEIERGWDVMDDAEKPFLKKG